MLIDPAPRRPLEKNELWILAGCFGAFLTLLTLELVLDFQPIKLSAVFLISWWIPLLVLHELGHALVAKVVGWRVIKMVIGAGPRLAAFRVGETRVELRLFALMGFVVPVPRDLRAYRLKNALIYFGGPGIELGIIILLLLVPGPEILLHSTQELGIIAVQSLAVGAAFGAITNLLPFESADGMASDGLGLIRSFFRRSGDMEHRLILPDRMVVESLLSQGRYEEAQARVDQARATHPESVTLRCVSALVLARTGEVERALAFLDDLERESMPPLLRFELVHTRALVALEGHSANLLHLADRQAQLAFGLSPFPVSVQITRGAALVNREQLDQGIPILEQARYLADEEWDLDRADAYLAIAAHGKGDPERAGSLLERLRRRGAEHWVRYVSRAWGRAR